MQAISSIFVIKDTPEKVTTLTEFIEIMLRAYEVLKQDIKDAIVNYRNTKHVPKENSQAAAYNNPTTAEEIKKKSQWKKLNIAERQFIQQKLARMKQLSKV